MIYPLCSRTAPDDPVGLRAEPVLAGDESAGHNRLTWSRVMQASGLLPYRLHAIGGVGTAGMYYSVSRHAMAYRFGLCRADINETCRPIIDWTVRPPK